MTRSLLISSVLACLLALTITAGATLARDAPPPVPEQSPVATQKLETLRASFGPSALDYLEKTDGKGDKYLPPSKIDPRFTMAIYVNASGSGPQAQRMWVLQRRESDNAWKMGLWDKAHWARKGLPDSIAPPYSWLVSTGRKYAGDRKSGPTPRGVFTLDDRSYRLARGYASPGMINVIYIDLHYSSGRRSGVAFHGTTRGRYRRLGRIDSHGCIRMTQSNALALLDRLQGRDKVLSEHRRFGKVPRFWTHERRGLRFGYTRDGTMHAAQNTQQSETQVAALGTSIPDLPDVLTKTGFRAIVVIFAD